LTRRAPSASTQSISCRSRLVQPSSAQPDMLRDHFRSPTNFCRRRRSKHPSRQAGRYPRAEGGATSARRSTSACRREALARQRGSSGSHTAARNPAHQLGWPRPHRQQRSSGFWFGLVCFVWVFILRVCTYSSADGPPSPGDETRYGALLGRFPGSGPLAALCCIRFISNDFSTTTTHLMRGSLVEVHSPSYFLFWAVWLNAAP
jgi:hypothetical protein